MVMLHEGVNKCIHKCKVLLLFNLSTYSHEDNSTWIVPRRCFQVVYLMSFFSTSSFEEKNDRVVWRLFFSVMAERLFPCRGRVYCLWIRSFLCSRGCIHVDSKMGLHRLTLAYTTCPITLHEFGCYCLPLEQPVHTLRELWQETSCSSSFCLQLCM